MPSNSLAWSCTTSRSVHPYSPPIFRIIIHSRTSRRLLSSKPHHQLHLTQTSGPQHHFTGDQRSPPRIYNREHAKQMLDHFRVPYLLDLDQDKDLQCVYALLSCIAAAREMCGVCFVDWLISWT